MAYRADIEIAIKGASELGRLQNDLENTAKSINKVNEQLEKQTLLPSTVKNLRSIASEAETAMRSAAAGTTVQKEAIDTYVKSLVAAEREEKNLTAAIKQRQKELGATSGMSGRRAESLALGVGFPLLFGGGPGAVLGGAAGSFIGGGFGGQIILSALGAKIDEITAAAAKAGESLTSTSKAFEYVKENSLFSSDAAAAHAAELEKEGKASELAKFLTGELAKVIGNDGVAAMKNLGGETTRLNQEWKALGLQIQAFIAGPLASLFSALSSGLKVFTVQNRYAALTKDLSPADLRALKAAETPLRVSKGRAGSDLPIAAMETLIGRFEGRRLSARTGISVTATDLQSITAPKGKKPSDAAEKRAEKEASRVAKVVKDSEAEVEITRIQLGLQERIFTAEQNKDTLLAARLKGEQTLLDLQYQIAQKLSEETDPIARIAITKVGMAKIDQQLLVNAQNLKRIEEERATKFKSELADLDYKLKLRTAFTEEARRQLEIDYQIQKLRDSAVYSEDQLKTIRAKMVSVSAPLTEQENLQKMYANMNKELQDMISLSNLAGSSAKNIGSAFGQAFQDVVNGSTTAQDALAKMMQQIGENFVAMAAQIIAQQTTMIILGAIMKALGVSMPGGGGGMSTSTGFGAGNTSQWGNIQNMPTLPIPGKAGGGAVKSATPYLVGERGPELFVPGTSGGVMSNSDLRASMGAAPGSAGSPVLNMSFETSTINGVEYVSRDQLEAAMAETRRQAARDGAKRGMTMTLDRIQQSPQTRSRIGIR